MYIVSKNLELYQFKFRRDSQEPLYKNLGTLFPLPDQSERLEYVTVSTSQKNGYDLVLTFSNGFDSTLYVYGIRNEAGNVSKQLLFEDQLKNAKPFKILSSHWDSTQSRLIVALRYIEDIFDKEHRTHEEVMFESEGTPHEKEQSSLKYKKPKFMKKTRFVLNICTLEWAGSSLVLNEDIRTLYGSKDVQLFTFAPSTDSFMLISCGAYKNEQESVLTETLINREEEREYDDMDEELFMKARQKLNEYDPQNFSDEINNWTPVLTSEESKLEGALSFDSDYASIFLYRTSTADILKAQTLRPYKVSCSEVIQPGKIRVGLSGSVDTHIFEFNIAEDDKSLEAKHMSTFDAFGFIEESKVHKRFTALSPTLNWNIICDHEDFIYVYKKKSSKETKTSQHQILEKRGASCLGIRFVGNEKVWILTTFPGPTLLELVMSPS